MTAEQITEIRKIAKQFGVKGVRKTRAVNTGVRIGRQCSDLKPEVAKALIAALVAAGFAIDNRATVESLADKGLLDVITVYGA